MFILASNSPRRKQLLALGGWSFEVMPTQVDERVKPNEHPGDYVLRLASEKAWFAANQIQTGERHALVLAADTAVVDRFPGQGDFDDGYQILGKPANQVEAESMLRLLRGRTHQVYTGLALLRPGDGRLLTRLAVTDVPMRNYSDREMFDYINSGDPFDKAGAYAIQHPQFKPAQLLHGCYANVMGLPVCDLAEMMAEFGYARGNDIVQACQATLDYPCSLYRRALAQDGNGNG